MSMLKMQSNHEEYINKAFKVSTSASVCFTGLLCDIMRFHSVIVDEDILCGLCRGWYFRFGYMTGGDGYDSYVVMRETDNDIMLIEDGVFDFNVLKNILTMFGFIVNEEFTKDIDGIWSFIQKAIHHGLIPLVAVFPNTLPYFPHLLSANRVHFIAVYGYDAFSENVYIGDAMIPTKPPTTFIGSISLRDFLESVNLCIKNARLPIGIWTIIPMKKQNTPTIDVYIDSLKLIKNQNLTTQPVSYYGQGFISAGTHGIECLYADLTQLADDPGGMEFIVRNSQNLYSGINSAVGPAIARLQIARYLSKHKWPGDTKTVINLLNNMSFQWRVVANKFARFGFTRDIFVLRAALEYLEQLIALEGQALALLDNIYQ